MHLRLDTLGGLRATRDGNEVRELPGQRLRACVLVAACTERQVSRQGLISMLWPETTDKRARQSLRQALFQLKRVMGPDWFDADSASIRIGPDVSTDVRDFEAALEGGRLAEAIECYRGPFLEGVELSTEGGWERWVDSHRSRLARAFREACRTHVEELGRAGQPGAALTAARRWVAPDPFDDEGQHALIELLAWLDRRSDAIRQYQNYERVLASEDLHPLDETRELYERLRAGEPHEVSWVSAPPAEVDGQAPTASPEQEVAPTAEPPVPEPPSPELAPDPLPEPSGFSWRSPVVVGAVIALAAGWYTFSGPREPPRPTATDPTRIVVFPFAGDSLTPELSEWRGLVEALGRWSGIQVVDVFQTMEAVDRSGDPVGFPSSAGVIARDLGAGRFVLGQVLRVRDSLQLDAVRYDSESSLQLTQASVRLARPGLPSPDVFADLATELLLGEPDRGDAPTSLSFPARVAFQTGDSAVAEWDLEGARNAFREATRADPDYATAWLWLAQIQFWERRPANEWRFASDQAVNRLDQLPEREGKIAEALTRLAAGDVPEACRGFDGLADDYGDFVSWYGLATCLRADGIVVRDTESPTGWSFRSSRHRMVEAYQRAFSQLPSIHAAAGVREDSFASTRDLFHTSRTRLRRGRSLEANAPAFYGFPAWVGDSLAYFAIEEERLSEFFDQVPLDWTETAILRQRDVFSQVATAWAAHYRESAPAREAVAVSLELQRDPSAVDSLRSARGLADGLREQSRLATRQFWVSLKFTIPADIAGVREAGALADSILAWQTEPGGSIPRASLATVLGRPSLVRAMLEGAPGRVVGVAPLLEVVGPDLIAGAALGLPSGQLQERFSRAVLSIDNLPAARDRDAAEVEWLERAAQFVFPDTPWSPSGTPTLPVLRAQRQFLAGDTVGALEALARIDDDRARQRIDLSVIKIDRLLAEALLLEALQDWQGVHDRLVPALRALPSNSPNTFLDVAASGALARSLALAARASAALGLDTEAERWALCLLALWADVDDSFAPIVDEMRSLTSP